ncbi:MAG: hypothetical protein ACLPLP_05720 [Mycobacterium sp.]
MRGVSFWLWAMIAALVDVPFDPPDAAAAVGGAARGALTGAFYAVTYVGFGLPLILATVGSAVSVMILAIMALLASATSVSRAVRLRRDGHRKN